MARSLSANLTAAVGAKTRRPAITVSAEDHINHFETQRTTAANSVQLTDACVAGDGSIVRVRVNHSASGFTSAFQYQRITDPSLAAQWTTWTSLASSAGVIFEDCSPAVSNNPGNIIRAFAAEATGNNRILKWSSNDYGVTWSGPQTVYDPAGAGLYAYSLASSGNDDVFWMAYTNPITIGYSLFSGGSWSAAVIYTTDMSTYRPYGLAAQKKSGTYYLAASVGYFMELLSFDGMATWTKLQNIVDANATGRGTLFPRISSFDGVYHLISIDVDTGLLTGVSYSYPRIRESLDLIHWSSGSILSSVTEGTALRPCCNLLKTTFPGQSNAQILLCNSSEIRYNDAYSTINGNKQTDISDSVLRYEHTETEGQPSKLTLTIDNNKNANFNHVTIQDDFYQAITRNGNIVLSEGYYTGSPAAKDVEQVGTYHVDEIVFVRAPGRNEIELICYDNSRQLDTVNRFQSTYTNQTVSYLLQEVCTRAGLLSVSINAPTAGSVTVRNFVLHAGQTYRNALNELCSIYKIVYFLDQDEVMQIKEISDGDASTWTYTPELVEVRFGTKDMRANHIMIHGLVPNPLIVALGTVIYGEAYDADNFFSVGQERALMLSDNKLTTTAQCNNNAAYLLAQAQRAQRKNTAIIPVNPALQMYDVIELIDQSSLSPIVGTGLDQTCRIIKQSMKYDIQGATYTRDGEIYEEEKIIYEQRIECEGV